MPPTSTEYQLILSNFAEINTNLTQLRKSNQDINNSLHGLLSQVSVMAQKVKETEKDIIRVSDNNDEKFKTVLAKLDKEELERKASFAEINALIKEYVTHNQNEIDALKNEIQDIKQINVVLQAKDASTTKTKDIMQQSIIVIILTALLNGLIFLMKHFSGE